MLEGRVATAKQAPIENFSNVARRHSALNCLTPIELEDLHSTHIHQAALS